MQTDLEGYEPVLGFATHGDMLGLDGLGRDRHASGAVALEDSSVVVPAVRRIAGAEPPHPGAGAAAAPATGTELMRRADTQYLMSAPSSEVRVARFGAATGATPARALGHSDRRLRLSMTRRDIASYLGVAHETVSRALTALVQDGCIAVSGTATSRSPTGRACANGTHDARTPAARRAGTWRPEAAAASAAQHPPTSISRSSSSLARRRRVSSLITVCAMQAVQAVTFGLDPGQAQLPGAGNVGLHRGGGGITLAQGDLAFVAVDELLGEVRPWSSARCASTDARRRCRRGPAPRGRHFRARLRRRRGAAACE
ncbi:MAG: helix-turn-helix domain-containing protein [Betaproteobacteria bacterium]|nr:helix-turn-helix domain-containing protein [Betaproteobacteria bacterium]